MPRLSEFYGIIVSMYFQDHWPPHFHVAYAEHTAKVSIDSLEILRGALPRRAWSLVIEWAALHREELRTCWHKAQNGLPLDRIEPLS